MLNTCIDILTALLETVMLYILCKNEHMRSKNHILSACILYFLAIQVLTKLELTPTNKLLFFLILNFMIGSAVYRNYTVKSAMLSFLHIISIYLGEMIIQSILLLSSQHGLYYLEYTLFPFLIAVLASKIVSIFFCIGFQKIFGKLTHPYNWRLSFCLLFPLALILWFMAKLQEVIFTRDSVAYMRKEALLAVGLIIATLCLLFIYQYYLQIKEWQTKKHLSESQMLETFRFYENRIHQENLNRQIYHDIQAHINTLENMRSSTEKILYSQELLEQLQNMNFPFHTGIETIDIVLNEKQAICTKAGIQLICIGDFTPLQILKPMELVTIFHNALENARQEYEHYDYPDKVIEVQTWTFHNFINLRFMNYYMDHGKIVEKEFPELHGFGIKNMKSVAANYNGEVIPTVENDRFYLRIIIPLIPDTQM